MSANPQSPSIAERKAIPRQPRIAPNTESTGLSRLTQVCKALGDDTRLKVIELLAGGERCVCELQATAGVAQSLLSFHLRVLRDAGMISQRRAGRWAYYSLDAEAFAELSDMADTLHARATNAGSTSCCEPEGEAVPAHIERRLS